MDCVHVLVVDGVVVKEVNTETKTLEDEHFDRSTTTPLGTEEEPEPATL